MKVILTEQQYQLISEKQLISEGVPPSQIYNAIDNNYIIKFYYNSEDPRKKGWREGVIGAYGSSISTGNQLLRIYQDKGVTSTSIPKWKTFRVDKITNLNVTKTWFFFNKKYKTAPELFNPSGDKSMSQVYKIAKFNK
jgi:hypothetical protein